MTRRRFVPAVAGAALASSAEAASPRHSIVELRRIDLRNTVDNQKQRTTEFLEHTAFPALRRAGGGPMGFFGNTIAPEGPYLVALLSFPSLAAMSELAIKLESDREYQKGLLAFNSGPQPCYERMESRLLRTFGMPQVVPPPTEGRHGTRLFELRMYESNNSTTLRRKIKMFNDGEMGIFQRLGMQPVFFGETIVGSRMP
ncbi:MAG: NIPSNAP family protein, partial [Bryobacteraceae bacterium]